MEHSPLPWKVSDVIPYGIINPSGNIIALTSGMRETRKTGNADAAFIVRACNSHDALLNCLKELQALVWGECPSLLDEDSGGSSILDGRIDDAIKLAEGR